MARFDDRTVTLDAPDQLADLGAVFASKTRIAVLGVLVRSDKPLHINEVARRVGVDASPVRAHLELLVKEGLAREVDIDKGRERKFETTVTNVVVTVEGVNRAVSPDKTAKPPRAVERLQRKLAAMQKDISKIEAKAREVNQEIAKEWARAGPPVDPQR
ncbi:MAG TPA: winged helix-turn-helix transcriptional regulator [Candidatus Thermoplasmatota archaeon]|nr:winged helix-turn-helix transcriptional regulator [Candidatus Thermoplasmatota archaeon]